MQNPVTISPHWIVPMRSITTPWSTSWMIYRRSGLAFLWSAPATGRVMRLNGLGSEAQISTKSAWLL